jgi:hypothetical protein
MWRKMWRKKLAALTPILYLGSAFWVMLRRLVSRTDQVLLAATETPRWK